MMRVEQARSTHSFIFAGISSLEVEAILTGRVYERTWRKALSCCLGRFGHISLTMMIVPNRLNTEVFGNKPCHVTVI